MAATLSPDGHCLAVAHGASVWIAERGPPVAPAQVLDLPDPAVAVACGAGRLFALTERGMLVMGDRRGRLELRRRIGARGVGVGTYGDHVVAFSDSGWLRWRVDDGSPDGTWGKERFSFVDGVVDGACMGDGRLAVLTERGRLRIYDAHDRRRAVVSVPGGAVVVPGGPAGWFVACGEEVVQVEPSGRVRPVVVCDSPVRELAASPDGHTLAVAMGEEVVTFWSVVDRVPRARAQLFGHRVTGLAYGPNGVVGVGLGLGDGNWLDLRTERIHRNEPPAGLVRRTWGVGLTTERWVAPSPGVAPDALTVGASQSLRLPPRPPWGRPELAGLVALGVGGLVTGWVMGAAALP